MQQTKGPSGNQPLRCLRYHLVVIVGGAHTPDLNHVSVPLNLSKMPNKKLSKKMADQHQEYLQYIRDSKQKVLPNQANRQTIIAGGDSTPHRHHESEPLQKRKQIHRPLANLKRKQNFPNVVAHNATRRSHAANHEAVLLSLSPNDIKPTIFVVV